MACGLNLAAARADEPSPLQRQAQQVRAATPMSEQPAQIQRIGQDARRIGLLLFWATRCAGNDAARAAVAADATAIAEQVNALPEPSRQFAAGIVLGTRAALEAIREQACVAILGEVIDAIMFVSPINERERQ
jgi:hypothetical protein